MIDDIDQVPTDFAEAEKISPYVLARLWSDPTRMPLANRTAAIELEELATMAALRSWLGRWLPIQIHKALLAGATLKQVNLAFGLATPAELIPIWRKWDAGQRALFQEYPDMGDRTAEHDRVEEILKAWEQGQ